MGFRAGRALFGTAVVLAAAFGVGVPAGVTAAVPNTTVGCAGLQASSTMVGREQRERQALGLSCDAGIVGHLVAGHSLADEARQPFGLFLTAQELREVRIRQTMGHQMASPSFRQFVERLGGFAGDYIDNGAGGKAVFLFTDNISLRARQVAAHFAYADRVVVRQATYGYGQLASLQARLVREMSALRSQGIEITAMNLDVQRNHVVVYVATDLARAQASLASAYAPSDELVVVRAKPSQLDTAPGVCVIPPPTSIRCGVTDAPTFKGGQEIDNVSNISQVNATISICTSGFAVGRFAFPAGTTPFILTAGHCGTSQPQWSQQAAAMGSVQANTFSSGRDGMIISVPAASTSNQVFFFWGGGPTNGAYHSVTAAEPQNGDTIGEWVCHAGIRTGESCGTLQTKTFVASFGGVTYQFLREATTNVDEGDSGGSVYAIDCVSPPSFGCSNNVTAAGILMGHDGNTGWMFYTHIFDEESALGVSVLTS